MNHLELFAGIGGFRLAMEYIGKDLAFPIRTVGFSEIDEKAKKTYKANFCTDSELDIGDIVEFINDSERFNNIEHFDLLSGGFPCQTFSMMGKRKGFDENRGQMFFRIMDIVEKYYPRYILLENVKNLVTHDKSRTINVIKSKLEDAGYFVHYDIFNSVEFGLPQKRNRTLIFARLKEFGDFEFGKDLVLESFHSINNDKCSLAFYKDVVEVLSDKVDAKYYLSERIKPTILSNGSAKFISNSDIDQIIARPLTASMHKMHRACQDNYYSDPFIASKGKIRPSENLCKEDLAKLPIRRITPQEAFLLQGFPMIFAQNGHDAKVADGALYKQAGNAVSVNMIYAVLHYLISNKIMIQ